MWGVLISAVAIVLLGAGGLPILQTMTLIASLPFAVLMIFMMVSLWKALNIFCNRRQSGQYFLVGRSLEGTPWPNDESDAGSRYHQIYEKYGASGNAGIERRIDRKIQYGRRNSLPVATG